MTFGKKQISCQSLRAIRNLTNNKNTKFWMDRLGYKALTAERMSMKFSKDIESGRIHKLFF